MKMKKYILKGIFIVTLLLLALPTMAQDENKEEHNKKEKKTDGKKWHFTTGPYLLAPSMKGDVAIKGFPVDVNVDPGTIIDNLDFGMMLFFEAATDKWAVNFDLLYMDLGKGGLTPLGRAAEVDIKQLAITVNGLYRVNSWFEVGLAGRINSIEAGVKIAEGELGVLPAVDVSGTETWFDPLIAIRGMTQLNNKWRLGMYGNIGGFGMGSDLAWEINPFVGYQFGKLFEIAVAYRWLGMDYETGTGLDNFKYDMVISGPEIGFLFHF